MDQPKKIQCKKTNTIISILYYERYIHSKLRGVYLEQVKEHLRLFFKTKLKVNYKYAIKINRKWSSVVLTVRLKHCHFENLCNLAADENSKRKVLKQLLLYSSEKIYFIEKENASSCVSFFLNRSVWERQEKRR